MEEVGVEEEKKSNEINQAEVSGFNFSSIGGNWEYRLWYVLCKWNFCKCFMHGNSYKNLIMFGSKENMEMVKWLFGVLSKRFVEFSKNRWKEYMQTPEYIYSYTKPSMARYQRGYLQGAVEGLDLKLKEISDKDKKQEPEYGTKVTALVLRTSTAIDEYIMNTSKKNLAVTDVLGILLSLIVQAVTAVVVLAVAMVTIRISINLSRTTNATTRRVLIF